MDRSILMFGILAESMVAVSFWNTRSVEVVCTNNGNTITDRKQIFKITIRVENIRREIT